MEQTQQRHRLQIEMDSLKARHKSLMKGRLVPNARAQALQRRILSIQAEMRQIDREASERMALDKTPTEDILSIIALPLLADAMNDIVADVDAMNDIVADVDAMLRKRGCQETVFGIYTRQIRQAALAMVDTLCQAGKEIPLLDVDDTLVAALKKKLMSFIKQRLHIKK